MLLRQEVLPQSLPWKHPVHVLSIMTFLDILECLVHAVRLIWQRSVRHRWLEKHLGLGDRPVDLGLAQQERLVCFLLFL